MDEERVGCYIKRYSEKEICRSLIELTIELPILDRVLRESMTDRIARCLVRKRHRIEIFRVPCCETTISRIWIFLQFSKYPRDLIHCATRSLRRPSSPELAIDLREFAMSLCKFRIFEDLLDEFLFRHRRFYSFFDFIIIDVVGIVIPDMDIILYEKSDIGVSAKEPEKLSDDSLPVDTLRSEQWESICEVESKLPTEEAISHISTSEIFIIDSFLYELTTEIEVLLFWVDRHNDEYKYHPDYKENSLQCKTKIEEIQSETHDRRREDILELLVPYRDDVCCPEVPSDEHADCECDCPCDMVYTRCHDPCECPYEPEDCEHTRYPLRLYRCELQDKGIREIIPHSRSSWKHIPDDREEEIRYISEIFPELRDFCFFGIFGSSEI